MAHQADQAESRDGRRRDAAAAQDRVGTRRNVIDDSEIHGPVAQGGNDVTQIGNIVLLVRNGLRRAEAVWVVCAALFTVLAIVGGLLVTHAFDDDRPATGDARSAPARPLADADTTAWDCRESAVVPGMKLPAQGMAPLPSFPRGGIRASGSSISIVLQGTSSEELLLTGARAEIVARHRPAHGVHVLNPCGSDTRRRIFTVDLDQKAPALKAIPDQSTEQTAHEFRSWPYAIKQGDAEYFVVLPQSSKFDTEFRLVLFWSSGGHKGRLTVPDHGSKPFRITATSAATPTCVTVREGSGYWLMPGDSKTCSEDAG
ncbi:hypothetical protein [Streptomyces sp. V3I7]|uniref:hypothetical protein n=1 Tax=Streptomyces sp. V3I7 TaxID=3042278 RepID=UPI002788DA25|nr:hypothetical protein [Streptomyces sp. V3I7]MDQ0989086.1 hypothetical protein [Streptomyces sp. V3I7]